MARQLVVVDLETERIERRPVYPPKPVGLALRAEGTYRYLAWGHPVHNNCTATDARARLRQYWTDPQVEFLFHNAKFDLDVIETHLKLPRLPWHRYHDTMFSLFLTDPYAALGLKPSAARVLGRAATERDLLRAWVLEHVPEARRKKSEWGAYISLAPGDLVGKYAAQGDARMTYDLHRKLYPEVGKRGMQVAYDRERRLLPYLLDQERLGIRVDVRALSRDIPKYRRCRETAAAWVRKRLKTKDLNLDSNEELGQALLRVGAAREEDFLRTTPSMRYPAGQLSMSKESLDGAVKDPRLMQVLGYYSRLGTCLSTFMEPWLEIARQTGGTVHPTWHQVRQGYGDGGNNQGARSGRLITSEPNFLNLAKDFSDKGDGYTHPAFLPELLELPLVRKYVLPDKGEVFFHRDYNQQELRILAHFEDGALARAYQENPRLDMHDFVKDKIHEIVHLSLQRRAVKVINFGILYGMGLGKLAKGLSCSIDDAKTMKGAHRKALPGVTELERDIKNRGRSGACITTWGGRQYYAEPPKITSEGSRTFEYKLLNYLIQGSAADNTKEALIRYHEHPKKRDARFLVTVYDEVNGSAPPKALRHEMKVLKDAMESVEFGVPMLTDGKTGPTWGAVKTYHD